MTEIEDEATFPKIEAILPPRRRRVAQQLVVFVLGLVVFLAVTTLFLSNSSLLLMTGSSSASPRTVLKNHIAAAVETESLFKHVNTTTAFSTNTTLSTSSSTSTTSITSNSSTAPASTTTTATRSISYIMQQRRPAFPGAYNPRYLCRRRNRAPLPDPLVPLLEQTTWINTNLSIVIMGDSVGMQLAGAYQRMAAAAGIGHHEIRRRRRDDWMVQHGYEILTHMPTASSCGGGGGDGHVMGWRLSAMLAAQNENIPFRNRKHAGGWNQQQIDFILNATVDHTVDAVVFRIPQGWISLRDVNETSLLETVLLLHNKLHMRVITFLTLPVVNNYVTHEDFTELQCTNERIRQFAVDWNDRRRQRQQQQQRNDEPYVLVLELGLLMQQAVIVNGHHVLSMKGTNGGDKLSIDPSKSKQVDISMLVQHRVKAGGENLTSPAALVCGKPPHNTITTTARNNKNMECYNNVISVDGVHICMETFSGRILAGLSCQHACVFNLQAKDKDVTKCSEQCNQRYMNMTGPSLEEQGLIGVTLL